MRVTPNLTNADQAGFCLRVTRCVRKIQQAGGDWPAQQRDGIADGGEEAIVERATSASEHIAGSGPLDDR